MKSYAILLVAPLVLTACSNDSHDEATPNLTQYVNTHIGSGGHGHVFVGANVPYGMVQLGPTSIPQTWDWCSGYHESDSTVIGFSHTHLSGTGIGDLFDVTVMPVIGDVTYARGTEEEGPASGLWSYAARSQEVSVPGYYSVPLTRYDILAEMTATNRVGLHRYTFPASDSAAIVFDLANGGAWDKPTEVMITAENDSTLTGYRYSTGWAKDQKVYFVAQFSKPFDSFELKGNDQFGRASFTTDSAEQVLLKVALSPVSIDGAKANLAAELPGWDFEGTRQAADKTWNDQLSRVIISTPNENDREKFYTALYHTMIAPMTLSDVNGDYRGADGEIHNNPSHSAYTVLSLWDTYRAAMPLMSIINPEKNSEVINAMLDIFDQQGRLPVWHLWANETDCMVGNPGIIPVADAIVKKVPGVDAERAFKALIVTSNDTARGGALRKQYGFIPADKFNEAIAYDMEYAVADGAIAQAAKALGKNSEAEEYTRRSQSYRNYFDPSVRFMRGKFADGSWRTPFDPFSTAHREDDYCEGNAWQYLWLAPQDVEGLSELLGGNEAFVTKLDSLFTVSSQLTGDNASPDITGLIGQYAHGNEPGHHILYLYTMMDQPEKGADKIRQVLEEMYTTNPDGLAGNEDAGQMSAWYILSSLGFYEVEPASGRYWFGSPIFDKAEIAVPGGKFIVSTVNNSDTNRYIRKVTLNGAEYDKRYITHDDIMKGGELVFEMGPAK